MSHPSWVCGLKPQCSVEDYTRNHVTPFVGVWIETHLFVSVSHSVWSHPSWVCGLKLSHDKRTIHRTGSHPSWVCGLKHLGVCSCRKTWYVTPFVGVWIETSPWWITTLPSLVTPFVGVWIETVCLLSGQLSSLCHTLRGCVD